MRDVVGRLGFDTFFEQPPFERVCKPSFLVEIEVREARIGVGATKQILQPGRAPFAAGPEPGSAVSTDARGAN